MMHATHQIGGWEAKRHRLREAGLWNDVQEYYEAGRYIEIQDFLAPTRPPTFKKWPTERMVEFHMAAIRQQLGQVGVSGLRVHGTLPHGCHVAGARAGGAHGRQAGNTWRYVAC